MIHAKIRKQFSEGPESAPFSLDLEFETAAGSGATVLFGPSGSGKTLTLDSIAGFVRPDSGRILLDDDILFDAPTGVCLTPQQRNCGYVFQNYALFPHMTLRQNLEFAAERRPRLERHRRINEMIEQFHLEDVAGRRPHQVSGGQKQRCSIARALIGAPRVLLLDEPARGLDAPLRSELYDVLRQVRLTFGTPMLVVTHDLEECFELGDRMLVVRDGRLVQTGSPREVASRPANLEVARLLGLYNLMPAEIRALDPGRNTSRLSVQGFDIGGSYIPGHLIGDRITLCIRPDSLRAFPRDGSLRPNQIPFSVVRAVDRPAGVRVEFNSGLTVDLPRSSFDPTVKEWVVEFPAASIQVL